MHQNNQQTFPYKKQAIFHITHVLRILRIPISLIVSMPQSMLPLCIFDDW